MKQYIGNCINNPFDDIETLEKVIDGAREITKQTFLKHCEACNTFKADLKDYPADYGFYKYKNIYFYTHSAVEYFYR